MANKIRGIIVEIGGDTTELDQYIVIKILIGRVNNKPKLPKSNNLDF